MIRRRIERRRRHGEKGMALIIAILMLVALTAFALTTDTSSRIDYAAARANVASLGRLSCTDQVARFVIEQMPRDMLLASADGVTNGTCSTAAIAWVNFPIPEGDTQCILPDPPCLAGSIGATQMNYPFCPHTRAIAVVAPTPYTPGGSLVGKSIGEGSKSDERRIGVRIVVAEMPTCTMRYLTSYLDVAEIESIRAGAGSGDLAQ